MVGKISCHSVGSQISWATICNRVTNCLWLPWGRKSYWCSWRSKINAKAVKIVMLSVSILMDFSNKIWCLDLNIWMAQSKILERGISLWHSGSMRLQKFTVLLFLHYSCLTESYLQQSVYYSKMHTEMLTLVKKKPKGLWEKLACEKVSIWGKIAYKKCGYEVKCTWKCRWISRQS